MNHASGLFVQKAGNLDEIPLIAACKASLVHVIVVEVDGTAVVRVGVDVVGGVDVAIFSDFGMRWSTGFSIFFKIQGTSRKIKNVYTKRRIKPKKNLPKINHTKKFSDSKIINTKKFPIIQIIQFDFNGG